MASRDASPHAARKMDGRCSPRSSAALPMSTFIIPCVPMSSEGGDGGLGAGADRPDGPHLFTDPSGRPAGDRVHGVHRATASRLCDPLGPYHRLPPRGGIRPVPGLWLQLLQGKAVQAEVGGDRALLHRFMERQDRIVHEELEEDHAALAHVLIKTAHRY